MNRKLLANIGFLLQISGLLTLLPILTGFYFHEIDAVVSVLLTSVAFLGSGFLLNSLCERKDLDFKSSCVLMVVSFVIMGLIGSIPYIYLDPFGSIGVIDRITNGFFESVSGFTTTGFSLIPESTAIPYTLHLFGSVIELIGGLGIVFMLLVFFQKGSSLDSLRNAIGVEDLNENLRKTYLTISLVYGTYIILFTVILYLIGGFEFVRALSLVIDTLTGGFSPSSSALLAMGISVKICLLALMFIGSVSFSFIYRIITRKITWELSREVQLYILIILSSTIIFASSSGLGLFDSLFHVLSMSSSTGFDYIGISGLNQVSISILIFVGLIGGCGFSMAGGIKVFRLIFFGESIQRSIVDTVRDVEYIPDEKPLEDNHHVDIISANVSIIIFLFITFLFSAILATSGATFFSSLFEISSALTTNGATLGITSTSLGLGYKYLLIACMLIGRVEIMTVLVAVYTQRDSFIDVIYSIRKILKLDQFGESKNV
jgi:trk system potassium uptake protein TrkH